MSTIIMMMVIKQQNNVKQMTTNAGEDIGKDKSYIL